MFRRELKVAVRSLWKAKALSFAIIVTLALGIGVNIAIFSLVRAVLLKPLVNRNEEQIVYIRQSAPGIGSANITFSVPEIQDIRARVKSLTDVGEFSVLSFTVVGLGEPRQVRGGVVTGNYFGVMGLRPVLGRLLNASDDGPAAAGAVVLTHQFWSGALRSDPNVIGKTIRLNARSAQVVGVLEPSLPYPAATELIANLSSSPHHMGATMSSDRQHRMTEVFARMAPSGTLATTRQELESAYRSVTAEYREAYPAQARFGVSAVMLREQLTSNARTVMVVLFAAALLIFVIACSNVANLILARTVRRESELAVRAAVGADSSDLRISLLAESLVLCSSGAALGALLAWPLVTMLGQYGARFSVRALDATVDVSLLIGGVLLALVTAVVLAYVPRLPAAEKPGGLRLAASNLRIAGGTRRQLNMFAVMQIGASFVLVTGAVMLLRTFLALQAASPGFEISRVLVVDVPVTSFGNSPEQTRAFYRDLRERIGALSGVQQVAVGSAAPWRDAGQLGGGNLAFEIEGGQRGDVNTDPRARSRSVSPGYFASLGVSLIAGRDFTLDDRSDAEGVVIISESIARELFPGREALNRRMFWTDPILKFVGVSSEPRRIVGVVPDIDDEHIVPGPTMTVYQPFEQRIGGGRLFVHAQGDPYALVPMVTRIVRELSTDQPVEHAATLSDVRTEVLAPDRLNATIFGLFAIVALAIAIVGVGGVLAFSVNGRTREFGIKMALGSMPGQILTGVLRSGATIALAGIAVGIAGGLGLAVVVARYVVQLQMPGAVVVAAAGATLFAAAVGASLAPAARAARTNVVEALRAD
jgi:putative ABC transport system permease protein